MIRSDKMRSVTENEHEWFWAVEKLFVNVTYEGSMWPWAWKYFDAGWSPEKFHKMCISNSITKP